ncbi:MAG: T9SS type A sorting domain-containing protein [Flavobacteriales bacterium]|nr:T9SS type A sorting domain-containing protein [Flavobacteriales bacterium]
MNKHLVSTLLSIGLPALLGAQTPLVPIWSQQWAFGQDEQPVPVPVSADNHVAVDVSSGNVYITIDDQLQQYSPHFDLLHQFASDGIDLTQQPIPMLGSAIPTVNDPANLESTYDLRARNGAIYHERELNTGFQSGTTGSLNRSDEDGLSRWKLGLGKGGYAWGQGKVLVDEQGAVSIRSLDGTTAMIQCTDHEGWVQWAKSYNTFGPFSDAVLVGNTIIAARYGTFVAIDRYTGAQITSNVVFLPSLAPMLATDGTRTYFAYSDFSGNTTWGCVIPGSTPIWTRSAALNITITELEVDEFGRPWFTGNATDGVSSPVLVVTASDGSAHDLFTYGTSMNDLAMGDGQAYITGRLDNATSTYLIAIGTDITTSERKPALDASVRLYPQPASTNLSIANATVVRGTRVLDITGKAVAAPVLSVSMVDVSKLSEGVYFVELHTADGLVVRRFSVAR